MVTLPSRSNASPMPLSRLLTGHQNSTVQQLLRSEPRIQSLIGTPGQLVPVRIIRVTLHWSPTMLNWK